MVNDIDKGIEFLQQGNLENAAKIFLACLDEDPNNFFAAANMSTIYAAWGNLKAALVMGTKAVQLEPKNAMAMSNLGLLYKQAGELTKSAAVLQESLRLSYNPYSLTQLGTVSMEMAQPDTAIHYFQEALIFDENNADGHLNLALAKLQKGDFEGGFKEYEWRLKTDEATQYYLRVYDPNKAWDGMVPVDPPRRLRLLVYCEQGAGDTIQFSRYFDDLEALGFDVTLHIQSSVKRLYDGEFDCFVGDITQLTTADLPQHDLHCASMSLPHLLHYKKVAGAHYFDFKLNPDAKRVFVCWSGNPNHPNDQRRSIPFVHFAQLLSDPCEFHSFQSMPSDGGFVDRSKDVVDFYDTAKILANEARLVITCDSALAHLAGAMGIPCWVLVPYAADWRWGYEGETTPWYSSVKVMRQQPGQPTLNPWDELLHDVKERLRNEL